MYNRFSRRANLRSTYEPITPQINFELLAQSLQNEQAKYDQLKEASTKLPQYLQVDQDDVLAYKQQQEERMKQVAEAYKQGIQKGNISRKQLLTQIKNDFQPTGKAYGFQKNYDQFQEYQKQLKDQLDKGRITNETYNAAIKKSLDDFGKSYDGETYNQFSGYQTAEDIDITALADDFLKGWKPDTIQGRKVGKTNNGQYFYTDTETKEFVRPEDIRQAATQYLMSQPQARAYLTQLDDLFPALYRDSEGNEIANSMATLQNTIDSLSSKYGYLKQTSKRQFQKDFMLDEANKQRNRIKLKEMDKPIEHMNTMLFKSGYKHNKVDNSTWEKGAGLSEIDKKLNKLETKGSALTKGEAKEYKKLKERQSFLRSQPENKIEAAANFLSYLETPEGQKEYPGMQELREQFPRAKKEVNDTKVYETDAEYLQRLQTAYNTLGDKRSVEQLKFISYGKEEMDRINAQVFGTSNYIGDAQHRKYYPISTDNKPGDPLTWTQLKEKLDLPDDAKPTELRKHFGISGKVSPDNNIHPSGVIVNATSDEGDFVFVAATNSIQDANYLAPLHRFASPLTNPLQRSEYGVGFGEPIPIEADGQILPVISRVVPKFNEDATQVQYEEQVYSLQEDGSLGQRLPLTINEIITQEEAKNPFANQRD